MSKVRLTGSTSGYTEIQASAVAGDNTLSLPTTTNGTLVATDNSGRLLVGTDTSVSDSLLQIQGTAGDTTAQGAVSLRRGYTPISDLGANSTIGKIDFEVSNGGVGARIAALGDAAMNTGDYPSRLVFSTTADGASSPTERMRINNSGVIEFNKPDVGTGTWLQFYGGDSSQNVAFVTSDGGGNEWHFGRSNADGYFYVVRQTGTGMYMNTNSWVATSDQRAKQNIADIESTIDVVKALKPSRFNWKSDGTADVGFIAQQVQPLIPEAVVDRENPDAMLGITQDKLLPFVVKALQEAVAKIETLEAANTDLAARITALEAN
jgi:hypothetical protein